MVTGRNGRFDRRDFLRLSAAGAALCALSQSSSGAPGEGEEKKVARIPLALQLYSVRGECEKNLPPVIQAVGKMGYEGVEFAGYYGRNAKELRSLLDGAGLKCCGTHIGIETLLGDELKKTVEFNEILGNRFLIVPGLPGKYTRSAEAWLDTAKLFDELAEKVKPRGMRVGYHNHTEEFKPLEGKLPWDIFFGNTRKDVVMQFDTGNALIGGGEPMTYLKRYPGRAATIHVKEFSKKNPKALICEGDIDWKALFEVCETTGGTEWYIVEYESDAYPPLESVRRCIENLRKMGKAGPAKAL